MLNYLFYLFVTKLNAQAERRHFMPFIIGAICGGFGYAAVVLFGGNGVNVPPLVASLLIGAFLGAIVAPLPSMPAIDANDFEIGQLHRIWYFPKREEDEDDVVVNGPFQQMVAMCDKGIFSLLNSPHEEEEARRLLQEGRLPITSRMHWTELTDIHSVTFRRGAGRPTQLRCIDAAPHASIPLFFADDQDREEFLQLCASLKREALERHEEPMSRVEALKVPCMAAGLGMTLGVFMILVEHYAPASGTEGSLKDLGIGCIVVTAAVPLYVMIRWPRVNCVEFVAPKNPKKSSTAGGCG